MWDPGPVLISGFPSHSGSEFLGFFFLEFRILFSEFEGLVCWGAVLEACRFWGHAESDPTEVT